MSVHLYVWIKRYLKNLKEREKNTIEIIRTAVSNQRL